MRVDLRFTQGEAPMLRRDFLACAVSAPVIAGISEKTPLARAIENLEAVLRGEVGISRVEVRYDPKASLPLFIAAYASKIQI